MVPPWAVAEFAEPQGSGFLHNRPASLYIAKRASCAANGFVVRKLCRDCHFCAFGHCRASGTGTWMDIHREQGAHRPPCLCGLTGTYRYLVPEGISLAPAQHRSIKLRR